ncbi:LptF/LptG family permease, partial [Candidatus Aerophobetes bacterium]|nr:LptF/LptG family permease [Candidatus Aerophobetes bacterium]
YKAIYREILLKRPQLQIKEKTLINLDEKRIYAFSVDREMREMKNIVLFDFSSSQNQKFPQLLIAERGKAKEEEIYLEGVRFYRANPDYRLSFYGECQTQTIYLQHEDTFVKELKKDSWDMTFNEIREMLKKEDLSPQERRKLETDLQGRIAIPLATVILGILAVPLGIKVERGEKSISLGISLIIVVVYYIFFLAGSFLSQAEILSPFLGIWIANFVLFSLAIFLNIQMVRK